MRLTMKQRQAVTAVTVQRYRQGSKKVKRQILDEFCETTGYSRGYARFVLRNHGRQVWLHGKGWSWAMCTNGSSDRGLGTMTSKWCRSCSNCGSS